VWAVAAAVSASCAAAAQGQRRGLHRARPRGTIAEIDGPADYVDLAEHLGLDEEAVAERALRRHLRRARCATTTTPGRDLGVLGTPTFVVDGLLVDASATLDGARDALTTRIARALVLTVSRGAGDTTPAPRPVAASTGMAPRVPRHASGPAESPCASTDIATVVATTVRTRSPSPHRRSCRPRGSRR
jgi:hypothetical protein